TFDVSDFGFASVEFASLTDAILDEVKEDYFDELVGTVAGPVGSDLAVDFILGDIGTPPPGVSEFYFIQIGTGVAGPHASGALGVAAVDAVRSESGTGPNFGIAVGDVVGSVFTDTINSLGGLQPSDALTGGFTGRTINAISGTTSHEIAHTISLSHVANAGSDQPTEGLPPIMGTGAIDLQNDARLADREFSLAGTDTQDSNASRQHVQQLVNAVGLRDVIPGSISGYVYIDANEDGSRNSAEGGLSGVTVFADFDNDAVLDDGEPFALTNFAGDYTLGDIARDNVVVRQTSSESLRQTGSESASVMFTEFSELSPDFVEIQNTAPDSVDTSGWFLASNDGLDSAFFGLNNVHPQVFPLPTSMAPGEILTATDDPFDANFWGDNLNFVTGVGGWLLLIDDEGRIRDSFFAGFAEEEIATFSVTINGISYTSSDLNWFGDGVPLTHASDTTYQRIGAGDSNTALDFVLQEASQNAPNPNFNPTLSRQQSGRRITAISNASFESVDLGNAFSAPQQDAYFSALIDNGNRELHFLDGSTRQSRLVADLAGNVSSEPEDLVELPHSDLLFTALDESGQRELFRSDGSAAGTFLVRDLSGARSSAPAELTNVAGSVFLFSAATPSGDRELYRTEGTFATTQLVRDLSGTSESDPRELTKLGNRVFFSASTNTSERELYVSDGTSSGTQLVRDLSGDASSDPLELTVVGNRLYFTAVTSSGERELFSTDGTSAGTSIVRNLNGTVSAEPRELTRAGSQLFFSATFGSSGRELYVTDGSTAETRLVRNLPANGNPTNLTAVLSKLYFVARATSGQRELYLSSNGTDARLVRDLNGATSSTPEELTPFGNVLLFTAIRPNGNRELHRSQGAFSSTLPIRDLSGPTDSAPEGLSLVGSRVLFSALRADGQRELFQTDGTTSGTGPIDDLSGSVSSAPSTIFAMTLVPAQDNPASSARSTTSYDHNGDGKVSIRDALYVVNRLASRSSLNGTKHHAAGERSDDELLSIRDALLVINRLDVITSLLPPGGTFIDR
ncbi:MAG: hypothetical protein AAFU85_28705, partial [Planctomycetota bacterium]